MKSSTLTAGLLLVAALAQASAPDDSIPAITPLFEPTVVEDPTPTNGDGDMVIPDLTGMGLPIAATSGATLRSGASPKVGTPRTEASVSPLGGAVWSMSFDCPRGAGGMTPSLGLAYSSQSASGHAGWGVSVSGLSSITRGVKTDYHDGTVRGVRYDNGDALFLDGRRLLHTTGTEGLSGAVYVPEGDPYTTVRVTSANTVTGPLSFEVATPDGHVRQYGATANARLTFTDGGGALRVHSWHVSRDEDPNGNYAEYSYLHDHLMLYPETVSYGRNKNTGAGAENYVRFTYEGVYAGTLRTFVIGGERGGVYKCLRRVRTMTGSSVYRDYELDYDPFSDGTVLKCERLVTVTCKNGAGEQMKPVTLEWNTAGGPSMAMEIQNVATDDADPMVEKQDSVFLAADLNGDGLADIVRISTCRHYIYNLPNAQEYSTLTYVYIHRSQATAGGISYLPPLRYNFGAQIDFDGWKEVIGANAVADIDGDGLNDLVIPYFESSSGNMNYLMFKCVLGKDVRNGSTTLATYGLDLVASDGMPPFLTGDFDGNGIEDVMCLEDKLSGGHYYLGISYSLPNTARLPVSIPLTLPQAPKRLFPGDFNGDGLPDIIALYDGGYKVFYNNGGTTPAVLFSDANAATGTSFGYNWRVEQGDFNGDGLVDFVYVGEDVNDYHFALNEGDGTFTVTSAITYDLHDQSTSKDDHRFTLTPVDIDRDGMTDLVVSKAIYVHHGGIGGSNDFDRTTVGWLLSDGTALTEVRRATSAALEDEAGAHNVMCADFDGDGWPELANNGSDWYTSPTAAADGCRIRVYHAAGFTAATGKLSAATDALGASTSFEYGTTASPSLYTHAYGSAYPLADVHAPVAVVSRTVRGDGLAGNRTTEYRYKGLRRHALGKGVLGFGDRASRDTGTGVTTQEGTLLWDTDHHVPSISYSVTTMGYDRDSTVTTMSVSANAKSRYVSFPTLKADFDMDGNLTTETYAFNTTYGYPTRIRTEYGSAAMYRQVRYPSYTKKGGRWLPLTMVEEQKHVHDGGMHSSTTYFAYDTSGNVLTTRKYPGEDVELTTTHTYDAYGNVLSTALSGNAVATAASHAVYDATGRFVTRKYVDGGGESLFTYDQWGNTLTATDAAVPAHPLTTSYTLDGWGDAVSAASPEGAVTTFTSGWGGAPTTAYYTMEQCPGKSPVKTWHDVRGRVSQTERKGPCNADVVWQTHLNGWGKPYQTVSRTGTRTTIEMAAYDHRGRPTQAYATGSGYTYYAYGNRSRTATHAGRAFTTTYDAWDNPLESDGPTGSVSYTYGSNGLPAQVEAGGSTVSMEYDAAGNRTLLDDPDAGQTSSTYSADGRLLSCTDGRGITTQNTYDALGRLTQSACDTLVTAYTYGESGNGRLRLMREETNGRASVYTYDSLGRVVFDMRNYGDGMTSGQTYAYDSVGHVTRHIYPSGLTVDYTYDGHGHMQAMSCNGSLVWQAVSFDGWESVEAFGSTTVTTRLTQAGQLAERYVQVSGSTEKLHRMAFTWDGTRGNLTSRTGIAGAGVTETFSYDLSDRLIGVSTGGQTVMAMSYSNNGNILSKTGMGAYSYSVARPHAVAGVQNTGYAIASASQLVEYNPWGKASRIEEGAYTADLAYGPDGQRWKVTERTNGQQTLLQYPHADYEWRSVNGQVRQYHYLDNGVVALKVGGNGFWYYYALTDNVGSVVRVITGEGTTAFEAAYDAWGKPSMTTDNILFPRGFGGHEMLTRHRLVNMDGRLYDYELGRFLSPDNYVQEPGNGQSYNRYSYCLNNPLKYTDPTGDLFGIDDIVIGAAAFVSSYVTNGLTTHDWGWKSVQNGLISAAISLVGVHTGRIVGTPWAIASKIAAMNVANALLPSVSIPIGSHFTYSATPVFGFGTDGFTAGIFQSLNYHDGKFSLSVGGGFGSGYTGWKVGTKIEGIGVGYGQTKYSDSYFNGNLLGQQTIGSVSLTIGDVAFTHSNDYFGDGKDRWRSSAAELAIGDISVGTYVYTNYGKDESETTNPDIKAPLLGLNKRGAWSNGDSYFAPFWIGFSRNGQSYRLGYSHPIIQNLTQNAVHKYVISTPYFLGYEKFKSGLYSYFGRNNPLSIW